MKYSEKDLAALISEVESEFSNHLTKAEQKQDQKIEKSEEVVEKTTENHAKTSEETVEKSETEVNTTEEKKEFNYSEEDFAEMDQLYSSMTKSEAEAHYKSLKKSIYGEEEVIEKTEETETETEVEAKNETSDLLKSEIESVKKNNEELKKSNEELTKSLEGLTAAMTNFVKKAPKQKAITRLDYVKKSEADSDVEKTEEDVAKLNKSEIAKRLSSKIRSGELEKSDKESIDRYYLGETKNINLIKHLL